jgi:hypothetical protein
LIKEEDVSATAFVIIEIEGLETPARATVSSSTKQRLENGILPGHKTCGRAQHVSTGKAAAKKSRLTDLPRSA